ncbi:ATP-binding cassette domain-containing protein [Streptomyces sudanensis]|nr:ATP-binding cassette domain-containing protein [Streptomyces sudanensis]
MDDLTFQASPGQVTALLGPAGAGKTTALRLMLGLERGRGVTYFRGRPLHRAAHPLREVGTLLGDVPGHPARSVRGQLRMVCAVAGVPAARADDLIAAVGLEEFADRPLGVLSRGMDRRLGIATALLGDPHALVLDEPAAGLPPREAAWLHGVLRAHAVRGGTVLYTTADSREAARTADHVVAIRAGRLVADQDAAAFARTRLRPRVAVRTPHAARLASQLAREARAARRPVEAVAGRGNELYVYGSDCAEVGEAAFRHGILLHRLAEETGPAPEPDPAPGSISASPPPSGAGTESAAGWGPAFHPVPTPGSPSSSGPASLSGPDPGPGPAPVLEPDPALGPLPVPEPGPAPGPAPALDSRPAPGPRATAAAPPAHRRHRPGPHRPGPRRSGPPRSPRGATTRRPAMPGAATSLPLRTATPHGGGLDGVRARRHGRGLRRALRPAGPPLRRPAARRRRRLAGVAAAASRRARRRHRRRPLVRRRVPLSGAPRRPGRDLPPARPAAGQVRRHGRHLAAARRRRRGRRPGGAAARLRRLVDPRAGKLADALRELGRPRRRVRLDGPAGGRGVPDRGRGGRRGPRGAHDDRAARREGVLRPGRAHRRRAARTPTRTDLVPVAPRGGPLARRCLAGGGSARRHGADLVPDRAPLRVSAHEATWLG